MLISFSLPPGTNVQGLDGKVKEAHRVQSLRRHGVPKQCQHRVSNESGVSLNFQSQVSHFPLLSPGPANIGYFLFNPNGLEDKGLTYLIVTS